MRRSAILVIEHGVSDNGLSAKDDRHGTGLAASRGVRSLLAIALITAAPWVAACASTPESRLRDEVLLDVYWTTAKECESRHRSLHLERVGLDGDLDLRADADSRIDAAGFRECYWQGVRARVERRRAAGLPVPEGVNEHPDINMD